MILLLCFAIFGEEISNRVSVVVVKFNASSAGILLYSHPSGQNGS